MESFSGKYKLGLDIGLESVGYTIAKSEDVAEDVSSTNKGETIDRVFGEYHLGLDIGLESVGYTIAESNSADDDAKSISDTRLARSARRRIARAKWRNNFKGVQK